MRRDAGYVAMELALGLGLLVLPMALLALSFPAWVEHQSLATAAAQEAARAVVISASAEQGEITARRLVSEIAANNGLSADGLQVCFATHRGGRRAPTDCGAVELQRGAAVTAHVQVRLPALSLPGLGVSLGEVVRTVSHTEHVDRYRGLP